MKLTSGDGSAAPWGLGATFSMADTAQSPLPGTFDSETYREFRRYRGIYRSTPRGRPVVGLYIPGLISRLVIWNPATYEKVPILGPFNTLHNHT